MTKIKLLFIYIFMFAVFAKAADIDNLSFSGRRITTANGLSSNTVYDIQQDKNGFIWFGADYGLCRYDGYSFNNYLSLSSDRTKRSDATIGNLYKDDENNLIWIHTSTFTFACYDIEKGCFIDYTGKGDEQRSFRRFIRQGDTLWMYDTRNGIRRISYENGKFTCNDYNTENKTLPTNHIARMVEDDAGNVWAMATGGLIRIDKKGEIKILSQGKRQIDGISHNNKVVCLEEGNTIKIYSHEGDEVDSKVITSHNGNIKSLRSHFIWQGKWML